MNFPHAIAPRNHGGEHVFVFGPFRLLTKQGLLLRQGIPVLLGSRALAILTALVERAGELVSKEDMMAIAWPNTVVEPSNVSVQVAALRRIIDDGRDGNRYIINTSGRGYRFVAPVTVDLALPAIPDSAFTTNLPARIASLIGRTDEIAVLLAKLADNRLVTIVGTAGIGKTAIALEVAVQSQGGYRDGAWLIDLAPISDFRLVPTALAFALHLEIRSDNPIPGLVEALQKRQILLVFDNCEHVIEAAATLASEITKGVPGAKILATSRELLNVGGEQVHRLPALPIPPTSNSSAEEMMTFPAIQLFCERAAAGMGSFRLDDEDAPSAREICIRLDGIPLAIEFAAARVGAFGVRELSERLDDRFRLLIGNSRSALPRHRTIAAALEWSYQLLSESDQKLLQRMAVFARGFTLDAAAAVISEPGWSPSDVADKIADLLMKSLVSTEDIQKRVRYRLLETTRAFALSKLAAGSEEDEIRRRHATYFAHLLDSATERHPQAPHFAFDREIDNVRSALDWASCRSEHEATAVDLSAYSASGWLQLSLLNECRTRMEFALTVLPDRKRGTRQEMLIQTAYGMSEMLSKGMSEACHAALLRGLELAETLHNTECHLCALNCLAMFCFRREDFVGAHEFSSRSGAIASVLADPVAQSVADGLLCASLMGLGQCSKALVHGWRAYERNAARTQRPLIARYGFDYSVQNGSVIAQTLWHTGMLDQAAHMSNLTLSEARNSGHPVSIAFALVWVGCLVSLGRGDIEFAERSAKELGDLAVTHGMASYKACTVGFEGILAFERGDLAVAEALMQDSLTALRATRYEIMYTPFLMSLSKIMAARGDRASGIACIDEAIQRIARGHTYFWMPEALRLKGDILLETSADPVSARAYFDQSMEMAIEQGGLSCELRTAVSIGRLLTTQNRGPEAYALLQSVYLKFAEGHGMGDLKIARKFLDEWQHL